MTWFLRQHQGDSPLLERVVWPYDIDSCILTWNQRMNLSPILVMCCFLILSLGLTLKFQCLRPRAQLEFLNWNEKLKISNVLLQMLHHGARWDAVVLGAMSWSFIRSCSQSVEKKEWSWTSAQQSWQKKLSHLMLCASNLLLPVTMATTPCFRSQTNKREPLALSHFWLMTWSRLSESTFLRDVTLSYLTHWTKTHRDNLPCFFRTIQRSGTIG
jgi:hypothetical protein